MDIKIAKELELDKLLQESEGKQAFYGAQTIWWTTNPEHLSQKKSGLPCDPRGGVLLQTEGGKAQDFIKMAINNKNHYGKHGVRAFLLAYHGCIVTEEGNPTTFESWDKVNALIDAHDAEGQDTIDPPKESDSE